MRKELTWLILLIVAIAAMAYLARAPRPPEPPAPMVPIATSPDPSPSPDLTPLQQPDAQAVVLHTRRGDIVFELFPNAAPKHVARIKDLVSRHYYDGILFHRVIPDFMIQFGDPNTRTPNRSTWGIGPNDIPTLQAEFNALPHVPGTVSMARTSDPNSATAQFFICVGSPSFLDGKYTVFGRVIHGQSIADAISKVARDTHDAPFTNEPVLKASLVKR